MDYIINIFLDNLTENKYSIVLYTRIELFFFFSK